MGLNKVFTRYVFNKTCFSAFNILRDAGWRALDDSTQKSAQFKQTPHNVNSSCIQTIKQIMHERVSVTQFYAFLSRSNPIPNSFSSIRYSINTYPICFYPLKRLATGSFALLQKSHRNNPLLCVNSNFIRYCFRAGTEAIRLSVNIAESLK